MGNHLGCVQLSLSLSLRLLTLEPLSRRPANLSNSLAGHLPPILQSSLPPHLLLILIVLLVILLLLVVVFLLCVLLPCCLPSRYPLSLAPPYAISVPHSSHSLYKHTLYQ